jgi:dTMP kinase
VSSTGPPTAAPAPEGARGPADETAVLPQVDPGAADETAVLPPVAPGAADETAVLPPVAPGAADETAVLPPVAPGAADETAVLPPVRGEDPADRVPPGYFRDEDRDEDRGDAADGGGNDRTRELPQVDPGAVDAGPAADRARGRRRRSDWAEETPLDDLPTLADELLGPHADDPDDEDRGGGHRGGRGRRGR